MRPTTEKRLAIIVVIAAVAIAAAALFLSLRLSDRPDEARVRQLIDERLSQSQRSPPAAALDEAGVIKLIEERVPKVKGSMSEKELNARVEKGIVAFIEKQQRAEQERPNQLAKRVPPPGKHDHVYGNPQAPVTLIEYSDFECPFCKRFHATAKQLVDNSNGQVNWVYRHFPLATHNPGAQKQAEASECAAALGGNDAFWKYADAIYARTRSNGNGFPMANLVPLAVELGVDQAAFRQCLESGRMEARVQKDFADGAAAGVTGTPGNILWHTRTGEVKAVHGAQPYERLKLAADQLLKANKR